jgi:hypothetical protein
VTLESSYYGDRLVRRMFVMVPLTDRVAKHVTGPAFLHSEV